MPGSLIYTSELRSEAVSVRVFRYNEQTVIERASNRLKPIWSEQSSDMITWIDCENVHGIALVRALGDRFGWVPLVLEEILNFSQRLRVDIYDTYLYFVVRVLRQDTQTPALISEQVTLLLGPRYVVSFQEKPGDMGEVGRESLRKNNTLLRRSGPDFLLHAFLDEMAEHDFVRLERVGEEMDVLEAKIMKTPGPKDLRRLHELCRDLMVLRRSVWTLPDAVSMLLKVDSPLITPTACTYLLDLYDHTLLAVETWKLTTNSPSSSLTSTSAATAFAQTDGVYPHRHCDHFRLLSSFIVVSTELGLNIFRKLKWRYEYFAVWGVMITFALGMLYYFRRKSWI